MKRVQFYCWLALFVGSWVLLSPLASAQTANDPNIAADEPDPKMAWFTDARLGIFIHWGIYAVDGIDESWSFFNKYLSYEDYMDQLDGFTASNYDPEAWASLIKESGAQYAVLTTKHHDGVALWDTKLSDLNVVDATPAKRDLVDDLSTFLNGFRYATFTNREGRIIGGEPQRKWVKPSILLVNEGNYSDGHCFPYAYRTKKIGKIVGMPIAGTCSWVSGTGMPDGQSSLRTVHLSFDDLTGRPLENQPLAPDFMVRNTPQLKSLGRDEQVERAVKEMLGQLGAK